MRLLALALTVIFFLVPLEAKTQKNTHTVKVKKTKVHHSKQKVKPHSKVN
jgi:hypothetical protein